MASGESSNLSANRPSFNNKLKCLIVDDDKICRVLLGAQLKHFGIEDYKEAINGEDAVKLFCDGETFDIVFMDCDMPIMRGTEAVTKLKSMGITSKIVGVTTPDNMEELGNAGADVVLPKPIDRAKLLTVLQEVAGKL